MPKRIVFRGKGLVDLEEQAAEPIRPDAVRLKTEVSLISTGTEGTCLMRLFEAGTHWDDWVKYPFFPGYSTVGQVVEVGSGVSGWEVGQRAVAQSAHASEAVLDARHLSPVPDGVEPEQASWFALATVAFMAAKDDKFRLGDSIAVVGAGPLGQIVVRWASACGVRHLVSIDPMGSRLEHAKRGGATATVCAGVADAVPAVIEACGGVRPRLVVDVTGHAQVFQHCLALPRDHGVLVLLGDSGTPSEQRLTRDVIRRGLQIVGAHGSHTEGQWTRSAIESLFFGLLLRGGFGVAGLITHVFPPDQYKAAYDLVTTRRQESMGILFDWR